MEVYMNQENDLILSPPLQLQRPPQLGSSTQRHSGKKRTKHIKFENFNKALFPFTLSKSFYTIVEKLPLENESLLPRDRTFANMEVAEYKTLFNKITPDMLIKFIKKLNNKAHFKTLKRDYFIFNLNRQLTQAEYLEIDNAIQECGNRLNQKQKKKN